MIQTCECGGMFATEPNEGIACSPEALCHCWQPRKRETQCEVISLHVDLCSCGGHWIAFPWYLRCQDCGTIARHGRSVPHGTANQPVAPLSEKPASSAGLETEGKKNQNLEEL